MSAPRPELTSLQRFSVEQAREMITREPEEILAAEHPDLGPGSAYAYAYGRLRPHVKDLLDIIGELTSQPTAEDDAGRAIVADLGEGAGDEPDEPCAVRCGYVSHGQDLIEHMRYEHAQCTECGNEPIGVHSVSHEPGCPRLQPGYTYPAGDHAGRAIAADLGERAWDGRGIGIEDVQGWDDPLPGEDGES